MTSTVAFLFSNWLGSGDIGLGMVGTPHTITPSLYFQSSFLAPAQRPEPVINLTLPEAWQLEDGLFLLLGTVPDDWQAFAAEVRARRPAGCGFLWVANADQSPEAWVHSFIRTHRAGALFVVEETADLHLCTDPAGYHLRVGAGCTLGLLANEPGLEILCGRQEPDSLAFGRGDDRLPLHEGRLALAFATDAGLRMDSGFTIPSGTAQADWFDRLDIGLRFSYPSASTNPAGIASVRYPVFAPSAGVPDAALRLSIAPGRMTDPEASYLALKKDEDLTLPTYYRTLSGKPLLLHPTALRFAFARRPILRAPSAAGLTLTPDGPCELRVGTFGTERSGQADANSPALAATPADYFACGAAGTEAIALPDAHPGESIATFTFVSGQPGHAPGPEAAVAGAALSSRTTTSWVRIYVPNGSLAYLSQPAGDGALYRSDGSAASPVTVLSFQPMQAGSITEGQGRSPRAIPLVPLAAVAPAEIARALDIEVSAIAPERKACITTGPSPGRARPFDSPADVESWLAVTPRGLACRFERTEPSADAVWKDAVLARIVPTASSMRRSQRAREVVSGNAGSIVLQNIDGRLESALLASQQCLVISSAASMAAHLVDHTTVTLSHWTFRLAPDVELWQRYGTIMIVKNADAPLGQLALDLGSWTHATDFNQDPRDTCRRLAKIFADAREALRQSTARARRDAAPADSESSDLAYFVETILDSPGWNGCLFLNVALVVPDQLGGLRGGIEMSRFYAHHLGVTQHVFTSLQALQTTSSDMFGLVAYDGPAYPLASETDYRFRVKRLGLTFQRSMLTRFEATLELFLASLFGKRPMESNSEAAVLVLDGSRQLRGPQDLYMFALREARHFHFDRGPLKLVSITQAEFETLGTEPATPGGPPSPRSVASRFSFVGALELAAAKVAPSADGTDAAGVDILSFSSLGFSALRLDMSFEDVGEPPAVTFAFEIAALQLEAGRSTARSGSLFAGFPLKLGRLIRGAQGAAPGSQGFMTVTQPLTVSELGRDWYGVVLTLDLGKLSDLAGKLGFETALLTAWGARDDEVLLGLKLPGSSGASAELSLLGVLRAEITTLALRGDQNAGYALMLNGVRLKAFGKTMPSSGSVELFLFGHPDPAVDQAQLGWYGAYKREPEVKDDGAPRLRPGRPTGADRHLLCLPDSGPSIPHRFPLPLPRGVITPQTTEGERTHEH